MNIYTRHFFDVFLRRFIVVFLFLQIFLSLCSVVDFIPRHPYVSLGNLAAGLIDLVLLLLPVSLPFSLVVGASLYLEDIRRQQGFLRIQLAGKDPRRFQMAVIGLGMLLSPGLWWLNTSVLPKVQYNVKYVIALPDDSLTSLGIKLAQEPKLVEGFISNFKVTKAGGLFDFSLVSNESTNPTIVAAQTAKLDLINEGHILNLQLSDGRFLKLDSNSDLTENISFKKLFLNFDVRRLLGASKTEIINLRYYTNSELRRLPELAEYRENRGLMLTSRQRKRLQAIPQVLATRIQSAITPFVFLLMMVFFLGVHIPGSPRFRSISVITLCLVVLLPQQVFFESRALAGHLPGAWFALLPTIEAASIMFLYALLMLAVRRRVL